MSLIKCPDCGCYEGQHSKECSRNIKDNIAELDVPKICEECGTSNSIHYVGCSLSPGTGIHKLPIDKLGSCLDEAKQTICGERQDIYGNPEDSFALIGQYWSTYLNNRHRQDYRINAKDVSHMMMLFKIARCSGQKPSRDNYIDICGYSSITADRLLKD